MHHGWTDEKGDEKKGPPDEANGEEEGGEASQGSYAPEIVGRDLQSLVLAIFQAKGVFLCETHSRIIGAQIGRGLAREQSCTLIRLVVSSLILSVALLTGPVGLVASSKLKGHHCAFLHPGAL